MRILSLDISASSTGWAFTSGNGNFEYGTIKTTNKQSRAERLRYFREEFVRLVERLRPTDVVMEDLFSGINPKTLILLAKFVGVAEESCLSVANVEPKIISTNTVKAYFKVKKKKDMFDFIKMLFEMEGKEYTFTKYNDVTDALGQLLCFCDHVLKYKKFRFEREYGYLYEVG